MVNKLIIVLLALGAFLRSEELLRNGSFEKTYGMEEVASFWISDYVHS